LFWVIFLYTTVTKKLSVSFVCVFRATSIWEQTVFSGKSGGKSVGISLVNKLTELVNS
jgi:hypothetical protein